LDPQLLVKVWFFLLTPKYGAPPQRAGVCLDRIVTMMTAEFHCDAGRFPQKKRA
jgi:hypothetical protein